MDNKFASKPIARWTADRFVESLNAAAPSVHALEAVGLSEVDAIGLRKTFCVMRQMTTTEPVDEVLGELGVLLTNYDVSNLQIGMIRLAAPVRQDGRILIGEFEADSLVVDIGSGQVRIESSDRTVLWPVAESTDRFLGALALLNAMLAERAVNVPFAGNDDVGREVSRECAERAGGPVYRPFFDMALAIES